MSPDRRRKWSHGPGAVTELNSVFAEKFNNAIFDLTAEMGSEQASAPQVLERQIRKMLAAGLSLEQLVTLSRFIDLVFDGETRNDTDTFVKMATEFEVTSFTARNRVEQGLMKLEAFYGLSDREQLISEVVPRHIATAQQALSRLTAVQPSGSKKS